MSERQFSGGELHAMAARSKAKVRDYANRRDDLIREGVAEADAQRQAADEINAKYDDE